MRIRRWGVKKPAALRLQISKTISAPSALSKDAHSNHIFAFISGKFKRTASPDHCPPCLFLVFFSKRSAPQPLSVFTESQLQSFMAPEG
jgi:hypothetical protein